MNKLFTVGVLSFSLFLGACNDDEPADASNNEGSKEPKEVETTEAHADEEKAQEPEVVTFEEAVEGDAIKNEYGTYTIVKATDANQQHETGPIKFELKKVLLATFEPNEENVFLFEEEGTKIPMNLAITLIESENTSDDTVSFHPFTTRVTTETKGQYEAQTYLNEGESEHVGNVIQEFVTPFNLGDEDLESLTSLKFTFDPPSSESTINGEEVQTEVTFE
ncbi:lipoprotein [Virgibacillus salarius]|uniref:hypothetical protein n=1 Tax=Virgibacillus salarius TaxID=447199 RepID=UPI0031DFE4F2